MFEATSTSRPETATASKSRAAAGTRAAAPAAPGGGAPSSARPPRAGDALDGVLARAAALRAQGEDAGDDVAITAAPQSRRVLARTMAAKIAGLGLAKNAVTPSGLRAAFATLDAAWDELQADSLQLAQIDAGNIEKWRGHFETRIDKLIEDITALGTAPDPEQYAMPEAQIMARAGIADRFYLALVSLNLIRNALNKAWDDWDAVRKDLESFSATTASYKELEKQKQWDAQAAGDEGAVGGEEDEDEKGPVGFPHKGKHAPLKKWLKAAKLRTDLAEFPAKILEGNTTGSNPAMYKTRHTPTVVAWESTAMSEGLELYGTPQALAIKKGFTIVHGFDDDIGADHGEMTRFMRVDGDHAHPIIESHPTINTSFTAYIKKEIVVARGAGDVPRLKQIWDFLKKLNVVPARFGLKSEPKPT